MKKHIASERQRQALTVQNGTVRRQADQSVRHGDQMKHAFLQIAYEHVWRPQPLELVVVQRNANDTHIKLFQPLRTETSY